MSPGQLSLAIVGAVVLLAGLYLGFFFVAFVLWRKHGADRTTLAEMVRWEREGKPLSDWRCGCFWCGVFNGALDRYEAAQRGGSR